MTTATTRLLAIAALTILSSAARAGEAEAPELATQFMSTRSVAEVRAEALRAMPIGNGSTGFIGVVQSGVSRDEVKAQTASAVSAGNLPHGEAAWM